jgi:ribosomal protein L36
MAGIESSGTFSFKNASTTYSDFSAERSLNETPKAVKDRASKSEQRKIVTRDGRITVLCCFHPRKDSDIK